MPRQLSLSLFPPATHKSDSVEAFKAEGEQERSGRRERHLEAVLRVVREHPGLTAARIGEITKLGHIEAQRRLSDAKTKGMVYQDGKGDYQGRTMSLWYPGASA